MVLNQCLLPSARSFSLLSSFTFKAGGTLVDITAARVLVLKTACGMKILAHSIILPAHLFGRNFENCHLTRRPNQQQMATVSHLPSYMLILCDKLCPELCLLSISRQCGTYSGQCLKHLILFKPFGTKEAIVFMVDHF